MYGQMKSFQVLSSGKPVFFFEVDPQYADNEPSDRNNELATNLAGVLDLESYGPNFMPQMITRLPIVVEDRDPDHAQEGLTAWISPKLKRSMA